MGADATIDWQAEAASALEWWRDAGVDTLVEDAPRDWLAALPPPVRASPIQPATPMDAMPDTIGEFLAWRSGVGVPEHGWRGPFLPFTGPVDARIMVLVDCPDRDDGPAGSLLAGVPGRLFDRMLAAIGLSRDAVHLAAICAKRPVAGRMQGADETRLAEIARHHVALVAPARLLLLGSATSRAVLAMETLAARGNLHGFNHKAGQTGVVATYHPRFLIEKPACKAAAWEDLQLLTRGLAE